MSGAKPYALSARAERDALRAGVQALRDRHRRVNGGIYASPAKPICWSCSLNDDYARHIEPWPCPDIRDLDRLFGES